MRRPEPFRASLAIAAVGVLLGGYIAAYIWSVEAAKLDFGTGTGSHMVARYAVGGRPVEMLFYPANAIDRRIRKHHWQSSDGGIFEFLRSFASHRDLPPPLASIPDHAVTHVLKFRVTKAHEHLGHETAVVDGHSVHTQWCDGARGMLINTNEEFVVWWMNNEIKDFPFKFEEEKTYLIFLNGVIESDGMVPGKNVRATRILKVEAAQPD